MGITNFHKYIKQKYSNAFKACWLNSYDHVYIDINFALHYCSYGANNVQEIYNRLIKFIDGILQELVPKKSLVICTDGSAPLSKLLLQRKRRLTMSRKLDIDKVDNVQCSSLIFTPGTEFMQNLNKKLEKYLNYVKTIYVIKVEHLDSNIDEAELKLKYKMSENIKNNDTDSHVIVTNDADVVVMLASLENYSNSYIFCKSNHENETLSMAKLIDLHTDNVGTTVNAGLDFVAISIMLGNDYLPKINYVNFDKLWNAYKHVAEIYPNGLILDNDMNINKKFLIKLLLEIVFHTKKGFINNFYLSASYGSIYKNYFDGYTWCLHTYKTGQCTRYNYMYGFQNGPHPLGLIFNLEMDNSLLKLNTECYSPLSPVLYAMLVLPKASMELINTKYHDFLKSTNILYDEECCEKCQDYYKDLKKLNEKVTKIDKNESLEYKKKIAIVSKNMTNHKREHCNITTDDIIEITTKFNKFCQKIK
jgi:5'-3' exonuclease